MFSSDLSYYESVDSDIAPKESVLNLAVGIEYYLSPRVVLRGGLFTDMANTPDLNKNSFNQQEHINLYGLSASIGRFTRSSSLSMGASYALGTGEAQVVSGKTDIQDATLDSLSIYFSASNSF
jgi:hypothetical protein